MAKQKATHIEDALEDCEYMTAKFNFVKSKFPDVTLGRYYQHFISMQPVYHSKQVNSVYTNVKFENQQGTRLVVIPYLELDFEYKGKKEIITINSSPKTSTLCYVESGWKQKIKPSKLLYSRFGNVTNPSFPQKEAAVVQFKDVIKFSKLSINLKNNNFNDKMMTQCRVEITKFIQDHPKCELDQKYIDPKIKKLLMFV